MIRALCNVTLGSVSRSLYRAVNLFCFLETTNIEGPSQATAILKYAYVQLKLNEPRENCIIVINCRGRHDFLSVDLTVKKLL